MRSILLSAAAALFVASQPLLAQTTSGSPGSGVGRQPVDPLNRTGNRVNQGQQRSGSNSSYWFSDPVVRRELGLTPEQYDRLSRAYGQTQAQYNESLSALDQNRSMTAAERQARADQLRSIYQNNINTGVLDQLTTPEQQSRYNQLVMQYMGYGAFNRVPLREQLRLSDEQMLRINEYERNWDAQMNRFRNDYATDPQGASRRFSAARSETLRNLGDVLTPEQQQQYQQLTGNNVDFGASSFFDPTVDIFGNSVLQNGNTANVSAANGTSADPNGANVNPNVTPDAPNTPGLAPDSPVRPGTNFGEVQPGRNPGGDVQPGRNPGGDVQPGRNPLGEAQPGRNPAGDVQPGRNPGGGIQPGRNPSRSTGPNAGTPDRANSFPLLPTRPGINTTRPIQPGVNSTGPVQPGANPAGGAAPAGGAGGAAGAGGGKS